ncbi:HIT finger domain protein [Aspergillus sclerotialis]|uniref:HIT finger domain protein n=1 Tax=Aspergillus sclerotialis TaxID=2070753 RepID=A0A3A2Z4T9_9EURO|nr:HIT finger domain protein [Aspergillus sclerotialis]
MSNTCEVCSSEASKYRCPTCGLMSCSLTCTQAHKVSCTPKPASQPPNNTTQIEVNGNANTETDGVDKQRNGLDLAALGSSRELGDLLREFPELRIQLRDMYRATLEEEWESQVPAGRSRGKGPRNRGAWTREKGFKRGLGKVRKYRQKCEDGSETGKGAEGFMQFVKLVNGENEHQSPT